MKHYIDADNLLSPIFVERERRETRMPTVKEHVHNFYELYFLVDGQIDKFIGNRTYHLKPLDIVIVPPQMLHKSLLCKDFRHERMLVYFDERSVPISILNKLSELHGVISLSNDVAMRVFKLFNILLREQEHDEWYTHYVSAVLCEMLVLILRNVKMKTENYAGIRFEGIIDYVKENCSSQISLHSTAEHFFISEAHLSRLFKKNTGFTFTQYVNYQRIIFSHSLLAKSDMNIGEIASACGFENLTHFGRVFKQLTGYSPRDYRKQMSYSKYD